MQLHERSAAGLAVRCLLLAGSCAAVPAAAADVKVEMAGSLPLPDEAANADGTAERLTGLSGVVWLNGSSWAAAIDNSNRFAMFDLRLSAAGEPIGVADLRVKPLGEKHDYEDLAPCPPGLTSRIKRRFASRGRADPGECLLFCEEDTPAIRGAAIADGNLVGAVPLPEILKTRRPNRGLEAVAVEPDGSCIWTANEEALADDGPPPAAKNGTVVRLVSIPIPGDDEPPASEAAEAGVRQFAYPVDPPHELVAFGKDSPFSGAVAIVALGGGQLLVLERSAGRGLPPLENRIYLVDTAEARDVSAIERDLAARPEMFLSKRLLWKDALGVNLEGLALGPALEEGGRALVAIADNGGLGTPTRLVTFRLRL